MAIFQVSGVVSTSADGLTISYLDNSNYSNNTSGITGPADVTRSVPVYDSNGVLLQTLTFSGVSLTTTMTITKDRYLSFHPLYTQISTSTQFTNIINYLSTQLYSLRQVDVAKYLTCVCKDNDGMNWYALKADQDYEAAITFKNIGDAVSSQLMIDSANTFINAIPIF